MKFEVAVPIDGFKDEREFIYKKVDDFFSTITTIESQKEIRLMNFGALKKVAFTLPEEFMKKLGITNFDDISIYYVFVLQGINNENSLNTFSPIILNNKTFKMGQIHLDSSMLDLELFDLLLPKL
jgi:flagellar assembly factor FliW